MNLIHETPYAGDLLFGLDRVGHDVCTAVLKATFRVAPDGTLSVAPKQRSLCGVDAHVGPPGRSSVLAESDAAYIKPATDVVAIGHAHAPGGRPTASCDVALCVGPIRKRLCVVGDRYWRWLPILGLRASRPRPFVRMPLHWERAFGGADPAAAESGDVAFDERNPVGTGYARRRRALDGVALPNFQPSRSARRRGLRRAGPLGLGYVGRAWLPRRRYAGTYDAAWQRDRMPLLPLDFDERFFNAAPPDQIVPGYLRGGEEVVALHLSEQGRDAFRLPRLEVRFEGLSMGRRIDVPGILDTLVLDLGEREVVLIWRASYRVRLSEAADFAYARVIGEVDAR